MSCHAKGVLVQSATVKHVPGFLGPVKVRCIQNCPPGCKLLQENQHTYSTLLFLLPNFACIASTMLCFHRVLHSLRCASVFRCCTCSSMGIHSVL